ncbi:hypothetical protein MNEG_4908, partial [Monoraphidium neglectum]
MAAGRATLALLAISLAVAARPAGAQSQGAALERLRSALQPQGWSGIDPNKDICE